MIWPSSRKIPGMDSQTKTLIQLNAPQLLYLWRLAWLCQIAAYVQQQSTKPTTIEPKPLQEKKSPEQECIKEKPYVTVCCIKKKWSSVRRCTSSVPIFANGALSGAFGYLFGSAMAANDDSYGQNEMAMISQDKWSYIMSRSPRLSGLYDDADHFDVEYFDPRAISETGPTWENFGEYVADVGPYFIGGGSGGLVISGGRALLYRALSSPRIGHRLFTATRKNGVWNTGKLRFGWSGKNGSDVYHLMFRYKQHHIPTGIRITRPHPNP